MSLGSAVPACGSLNLKHLVISCNLGKVEEHLFYTSRRYYQQPVALRKKKPTLLSVKADCLTFPASSPSPVHTSLHFDILFSSEDHSPNSSTDTLQKN
jgi:hypothetical protein